MAEKLSFYDVKSKKKFETDKWTTKDIKGRRFAIAKNPKTGVNCWRVLGMAKKTTSAPKKVVKKK